MGAGLAGPDSTWLALTCDAGRIACIGLYSRQSQVALIFASRSGLAKCAPGVHDVEAGVPRLPDAGGFLACAGATGSSVEGTTSS